MGVLVAHEIVEPVASGQGVGGELTRVEDEAGRTDQAVDEREAGGGIVGAGDVVGHLGPEPDRLDAGAVECEFEGGLDTGGDVERRRREAE